MTGRSGKAVLANPQPPVRKVLEIVSAVDLTAVFKDVAELDQYSTRCSERSLTVTRGIAQTVVDAARRARPADYSLSASPGAVLCEAGASAGEALLIVSGIVESSETGEMLTRHIVTGSGHASQYFPRTCARAPR